MSVYEVTLTRFEDEDHEQELGRRGFDLLHEALVFYSEQNVEEIWRTYRGERIQKEIRKGKQLLIRDWHGPEREQIKRRRTEWPS